MCSYCHPNCFICRTWLNYVVDSAVYPVLAGHYIVRAASIDLGYVQMFAEAMVLIVFLIRMFQFDVLVRFSTALTFISLAPALLYIGFAFPHVDPSTWMNTDGDYNCNVTRTDTASNNTLHQAFMQNLSTWSFGNQSTTTPVHHTTTTPSPFRTSCHVETDWGDFLPYVFWCLSGFFSIGTLAGQVRNPRRDVPLSLLILIPIVLTELTLPLALTISIDQDLKNYEPGHFAQIAQQIAGTWLNVMITFAAITSLLGTCNAAVLVSDEALQSCSLRHLPGFFERQANSRSRVVRWFFATEGRVAPLFAVIDCGVLAAVVWMPYEIIISFGMELMNLSVFLFLIGYIKLKYKFPTEAWLYGRSWMRASLLSLPPFALSGVMSYYAFSNSTSVMGIPYFNLSATAGAMFVGLALHLSVVLLRRFQRATTSAAAVADDDDEPLLTPGAKPLVPVSSFSEDNDFDEDDPLISS